MKKILLLLIVCLPLLAADVHPVKYTGAKRMDMGGAGVAVINKEDSYMYNPAHAAFIKQSFHMPPFLFFPNSFYYRADTMYTVDKLNKKPKDLDDDEEESNASIFRRIVPSEIGLGANWSTGFVFSLEDIGSFAIGGYANSHLDAKIVNRLAPRFEGTAYADAVMPLAFAQQVDMASADEVWQWMRNPSIGIAFKHISRISLYDPDENSETVSIEAAELEDNRAAFRVGHGYGFDIGGQAEVDTFMGTVTAAVVLNNINANLYGIEYEPEIKLENDDDDEVTFFESSFKQNIPFSMTVGMAKQASPFAAVRQWRGIGWAGAIMDTVFPNAVYAADAEFFLPEDSLFKRLHFGMEQNYKITDSFNIDWRLGLNQGYGTTGVNFQCGFYNLGFTYYTEELGKEIGEKPSSYYVLHSSFVF